MTSDSKVKQEPSEELVSARSRWRPDNVLLIGGAVSMFLCILLGVEIGWLMFSPPKEEQVATQQQAASSEPAPRQEEGSSEETITVSAPVQPTKSTKPSISKNGLTADFTDTGVTVTDGTTTRSYEGVKTVRFPGKGIVTVIYNDGRALGKKRNPTSSNPELTVLILPCPPISRDAYATPPRYTPPHADPVFRLPMP